MVSIGSEHIAEVDKFCEALRHVTHFLSPVSESLDDTSLVMVVGFKVEIVVGVCLPSEHRSEDGGALGLLFQSELNGGVLAVEVVMEFTEVVVLVGPDCKHIIYISQP